MYIKLLLRLFLGYIRIEVEGYYIEKFINICTSKKILIWNLKREKGVKLYLNIGINDFKKLSPVISKTKCKIKILKKRGIPFLLHRYKKRKIFAIFLIIIVFSIYISSRYVWNIDIEVEENLELNNIQQDVQSAGLNRGILKSKIDKEKIINELVLKRDDIAWIGIDVEGTNVIIKIVKADKSPEIIDNSDYCDIVALKKGKITKITAQNGTAIAQVGDEVEVGDVLIAGYMEGKNTDKRPVHSLGEVEALVTYQKTMEVKLSEEILKETGKIENKYEINFNNFKIKLYKKLSKFDEYKTTNVQEKNLKIMKDFYLPISITKITNKEQKKENRTFTLKEAVDFGVKALSSQIEEEIPNKENIKDKFADIEETQNSVVVTVTYEVTENIKKYKKIF